MWTTHSATVAKPSHLDKHKRTGLPEDYAADWRVGDVRVLAVADGVGQADRAADAARLAIATAIRQTVLSDFGASGTDVRGAYDWFAGLAARIQQGYLDDLQRVPDGDAWRTTLALVAIVGRDTLFSLSFGDSFVAISAGPGSTGRELELLVWPERIAAGDRLAAPVTLHSSITEATIHVVRVPDLDGVLVSTDGLELLLAGDGLGTQHADAALRRMVEHVRNEDGHLVNALLFGAGERLPAVKPDDCGVAIAAWR